MSGYAAIQSACHAVSLDILGAFHPSDDDRAPEGTGTIVLLGPLEPGFWAHFTSEPESQDGGRDPMDRWSERVVDALAQSLGGTALFPFGGPPYQPFQRWAERSGRAWPSPVGLLVHDTAGLMVSFRGAIALPEKIDLSATPAIPCQTCRDKPCQTACPVGALSGHGYDLAACHAYLDTEPGQDCMNRGCAVRRACPVSQAFGRVDGQSAYHMAQFHQ